MLTTDLIFLTVKCEQVQTQEKQECKSLVKMGESLP